MCTCSLPLSSVCTHFSTQPHSWSGPADTYFELAHFKKDKRVQEPAVTERLVKGVCCKGKGGGGGGGRRGKGRAEGEEEREQGR